jgi:hypothetical protein
VNGFSDGSTKHKADFMARNTSDKKNVSRSGYKDRKGDSGRSSNEGRKQASGGRRNTNNQGRPKGV